MSGLHPESYRPGRNFIRLGDYVGITPSKPKKRDGFIGIVKRIDCNDAGDIIGVNVTTMLNAKGTGRHPKAGVGRAFTTDRIVRVDQVRIRRLVDSLEQKEQEDG